MQTLYVIDLAVLGLAVGSFLNVVIARLPADESIVTPRSHCPNCGYVLRWYENIPLFSWVALRGKCSNCKQPISVRYVIVELLTGALFLAALVRFDWTWSLVLGLTLITLLIPLIFIDAEHWVLPFELTLPGIAMGVLLQIPRGWPAVRDALIGAVAAFVFFRVLEAAGWFFARKEALGAGDKYLLALVGAFLGWKALLGVVLLSSLQGAVFGVVRIAVTGRAAPELPEQEDETGKGPGTAGDTGSSPSASAGHPAVAGSTGASAGASGAAASGVSTGALTEPGVGTGSGDASQSAHTGTVGTGAPTEPGASTSGPTHPNAVTDGADATHSPGTTGANAPEASAIGATQPTSPADQADDGAGEEEELVFTPDFLRPGLSLPRRLVLLPWTLFVQPIPDDPIVEEGDEDAEPEWVPGPTNMPFGPWIGLAAIEVLLIGPWIASQLGSGLLAAMLRMVFVDTLPSD